MIYPLLAAVIDSVNLVFTKRSIDLFRRLNNHAFAFWAFAFILAVGLLTLPWTGHIDPLALSPYYLGLALIMAILAANYNLLSYYGLKHDQLSRLEPLILFTPLLTILVAGLIYPDERVWQIYVAVSLALGLLIWSRWSSGRLRFNPATWAILGFAVLFAIEVAIIRQLLAVYSPVSLYLVRCAATLLFLWVWGRGRVVMINFSQALAFLRIAVSAVAVNWLVYFSYATQGVSATMVILIISPVLVYALSAWWLREKLSHRDIIAGIGVVLLVFWANLVR